MTAEDLSHYAAIAEILGVAAIIGGAFFGLIQMSEYKRNRRYQAAADRQSTRQARVSIFTELRDHGGVRGEATIDERIQPS